jgi:hypothetical protein
VIDLLDPPLNRISNMDLEEARRRDIHDLRIAALADPTRP